MLPNHMLHTRERMCYEVLRKSILYFTEHVEFSIFFINILKIDNNYFIIFDLKKIKIKIIIILMKNAVTKLH